MKNVLVGISLVFLMVNSLMAMPSANEMRKKTDAATKAVYSKLLKSENGKNVYDGIMKMLESNIERIAKGGFYDTFTIHYMNDDKFIHKKLLGLLSRKDQDIMRQKIIQDLINQGYKIKYNKFWDNPKSMNISISW